MTNDSRSLALSLSTTAPSIFSSIDGHSGKPPLMAPPRPRGLSALLRDELTALNATAAALRETRDAADAEWAEPKGGRGGGAGGGGG